MPMIWTDNFEHHDNTAKLSAIRDPNAPIDWPSEMVFGLSNCGIVALAACAGVSLTVATEWFRNKQHPRSNWRGATRCVFYDEFLRTHGKWFIRTDYRKDGRIRTVGDFVTWGAKSGVLYAVRSRGHMMFCRDGWLGDQSAITKPGEHWCRNKRVLTTWEICNG